MRETKYHKEPSVCVVCGKEFHEEVDRLFPEAKSDTPTCEKCISEKLSKIKLSSIDEYYINQSVAALDSETGSRF